jgi:hypothetical protein
VKLPAVLLGVAAAVLLCACSRAVQIYPPSGDKLKGIPFYLKTGGVKQTTIWRASYFRVTLVIKDAEAKPTDPPRLTLTKSVSKTQAKEVSTLRNLVNDLAQPEKAVLDAFKALNDIPNGLDIAYEDSPIANTVAVVPIVDYSKPHYINSWNPWFGSGSLTAELNADGTISKASVTLDSGLDLAALIPFKEYLEAEHVDVAPTGDPAVAPSKGTERKSKIGLTVEEAGQLRECSHTWKQNETVADRLPSNCAQFVISPIGAGKKEDATPSWAIEGSLTPPKPDAGE